MFMIFYFLMMRPQMKKQKTHQDFLQKLKKGDRVLTSSGIFGTIEGLTEKYVTLEIADEVNIRVLKAHVSQPVKEG
ncbi:MAG: preprotein translocase subunit YajC [Bdellovibrionales bacterium]|nr:preprotein translocase subunit YajC [Bdellovibrionales bacterium]